MIYKFDNFLFPSSEVCMSNTNELLHNLCTQVVIAFLEEKELDANETYK